MGTNENGKPSKRVVGGCKVNEGASINNGQGRSGQVVKRAVNNPVPGDGGKKK